MTSHEFGSAIGCLFVGAISLIAIAIFWNATLGEGFNLPNMLCFLLFSAGPLAYLVTIGRNLR